MVSLIVPTVDLLQGLATLQTAAERSGVDDVHIHLGWDDQRDGYTRTVNASLAAAYDQHEGDFCILADDCEVQENWLADLMTVAHRRDDAWFVGPSGACRTHPQNSGRRGDTRSPRYVSHLAGFCLYVRRCVVETVGMMDERFHHYGSDVDWQWRARKFEGRSVWVPGVYVTHELHAPLEPWWTEDNKIFSEMWP